MTKSMRLLLCSALAATLALPAAVQAQAARPRGGSSSSGSSSSGGGSGSGGSDGGSVSRPAPESGRTGVARPRGQATPPPMPSGDRARPSNDAGRAGLTGSSGRTGDSTPSATTGSGGRYNNARPRETQPTVGYAARRTEPRFPGVGVIGDWYPWYGSGFNWHYSPYRYDGYGYYPYSSRWAWGPYGTWYDPFSIGYYTPWYSAGGYGYGYGYGSTYAGNEPEQMPLQDATGSIRVRVGGEKSAKVYLDGTLMGTVDDFDGFTGHLVSPVGEHEVEVRADGYLPLKLPVDVREDKTTTVRGSLKKN